MQVHILSHESLEENLPASACCIGFFDGLHKGHQKLIETAISIAKQKHLASALLTFYPDPWTVFAPEKNTQHLLSMDGKIQRAEKLGIEEFYILNFTKAFAALSTDEFHALLVKMHIVDLICGFDFRYASKNSGSTKTLQQAKGFDLHVIDAIVDHDEKISSTRIEALVRAGDVQQAAWLLGTWYQLDGTIVHGYQRGSRLLQIPTANLSYSDEMVLPAQGVYFGAVQLKDGLYPAMINIGNNPTFANRHVSIEAHIFDFERDIYGQDASFLFYQRIRDQKKFDSLDLLKQQLQRDMLSCRQLLAQNSWLALQSGPAKSI